MEKGSWSREDWGGGGSGSGPGQHLGSRYVFSHVKEVVVAAHVLGGERAEE